MVRPELLENTYYFLFNLSKSAAESTSPAIFNSTGASTPLIFTKTVFSKGPEQPH